MGKPLGIVGRQTLHQLIPSLHRGVEPGADDFEFARWRFGRRLPAQYATELVEEILASIGNTPSNERIPFGGGLGHFALGAWAADVVGVLLYGLSVGAIALCSYRCAMSARHRNDRILGAIWRREDMHVAMERRLVTFVFGELDTLVPAYAVTIHKSQGSEYPAVVIPILTQHYAMLQQNLLYTAVTRGKRLVVVVGQKKAVAIAVKNISGRRRWSKLNEWLEVAPSQGSSP
jgi:UvrD-like helicase C-terminal domain